MTDTTIKYLALPLRADGWKKTIVNDAHGDTLALFPNGHKGAIAATECAALFAAAPEMAAAIKDALHAATLGYELPFDILDAMRAALKKGGDVDAMNSAQ